MLHSFTIASDDLRLRPAPLRQSRLLSASFKFFGQGLAGARCGLFVFLGKFQMNLTDMNVTGLFRILAKIKCAFAEIFFLILGQHFSFPLLAAVVLPWRQARGLEATLRIYNICHICGALIHISASKG